MSTTAAAGSDTGCIAHRMYADPMWNDAQRTAWEAARAIYAAKDALYHAYLVGAVPSQEPATRAWLAWHELERELAIIGLFAEEGAING